MRAYLILFSLFFNPNLQVLCEIKSTWTFAFFKSSTISDLNFSNNNIFKPLNAGGKNRQINRNSWWRKQIQLRECAINCEKYMYRMRRNNFWVDSVLTHRWTSARGKIRLKIFRLLRENNKEIVWTVDTEMGRSDEPKNWETASGRRIKSLIPNQPWSWSSSSW